MTPPTPPIPPAPPTPPPALSTATSAPDYDAIVIGGGPAGATAGMVMARAGLRVLIVERAAHPRFHIGESFLPRNTTVIEDLGLAEKLAAIPQVTKYGAEFAFGNDAEGVGFRFDSGFPVGETVAFNIERAKFDAMLLQAAREAGAEVLEGPTVKDIPELADGRVGVRTDAGVFTGRYLIDASGQATVVGKHLGTRRVLPHLKKVAYFGHFEGVDRKPGVEGGYPTIVMCREGWFWMIPIDERRTSLGMVLDAEVAKRVGEGGVAPNRMLAWGIGRCPYLRARTARAVFPPANGVTADFSYRCEPYAGPGYFLVGDAATFVDPIFSTGVCLGMMGGIRAAESVVAVLRKGQRPGRARRAYTAYVKKSSSVFFRMVDHYYKHSFRELFLHGRGPCEMQRAVVSILAGHVFPPHPAFGLRWRLRFFEFFIWLNRFYPVAPRRAGFSLLEGAEAGEGAGGVVEGVAPAPSPRGVAAAR